MIDSLAPRLIDLGCFLIGVFTLPNIFHLIDNKPKIEGITLKFSVAMTIATACFVTGFALLGSHISALFNVPSVANWLITTTYILRDRKKLKDLDKYERVED